MLVRELIKTLSAMNQDLPVALSHFEEGQVLLEEVEVLVIKYSGDNRIPNGTEVVMLSEGF